MILYSVRGKISKHVVFLSCQTMISVLVLRRLITIIFFDLVTFNVACNEKKQNKCNTFCFISFRILLVWVTFLFIRMCNVEGS